MLIRTLAALLPTCLAAAASAQLSYHAVGEGYAALKRTGEQSEEHVNLVGLRVYFQRSEGRQEIIGLRALCQEIKLR